LHTVGNEYLREVKDLKVPNRNFFIAGRVTVVSNDQQLDDISFQAARSAIDVQGCFSEVA
jgi:hypothetical protein